MRILMITSEIAPYAKVGGLADVVSSLSKELAQLGHEVRVICPLYSFIPISKRWKQNEKSITLKLGGQEEICRIWEVDAVVGESHLYFLENEKYFGTNQIYSNEVDSHEKNGQRFVCLSRAGIEFCHCLGWIPDVIHCHDWMTSLVPVYLKASERDIEIAQIPTILTIHNMQHQGIFDRNILDFAGLSQSLFVPDGLEFAGAVNLLKGGIIYATKLTTVSERYAEEILNTDLGCGLNDVLQERKEDLRGILNGIDTLIWNPEIDHLIPKNFNVRDRRGKKECKQFLQKHFNLEENPKVPIFAAIARLYWQKGLDLLLDIIPRLMEGKSLQVVILSSGEKIWEEAFKSYADRYRGQMGISIGHNPRLPHLIEAGSDFFLMPSRFEPCGLNQMYSMVYGSVPIVHKTGGLVDTVIPYVTGKLDGTGFFFEESSALALYEAILRGRDIFYHEKDIYELIQKNGMQRDFSWKRSVKKYEDVYLSALKENKFIKKNDI